VDKSDRIHSKNHLHLQSKRKQEALEKLKGFTFSRNPTFEKQFLIQAEAQLSKQFPGALLVIRIEDNGTLFIDLNDAMEDQHLDIVLKLTEIWEAVRNDLGLVDDNMVRDKMKEYRDRN